MANLYLSHWNAAEKVYVPEDICKKLKPYHLSIVRSLYRCWEKKFNGAILNYDEGIDILLAIQAFWQALINADKVKLPFLIIVSDKNIIPWHFYLSQLGEVTVLNNQNVEAVSKSSNFLIILVPLSNIKLLKACEENDYSFTIVEDFDNIVTTRLFKRLSGRFNIALTRRNFMVDRDCKILWHILNWTNPGKFGKLHEFYQFDYHHLENLRNPYEDVWYTYNCNVEEYNLDKVDDKEEQFEKLLSEWAAKHDFLNNNSQKKTTRKRKSNPTNGAKTKRSKKKNPNKDYHEQPTQIVGNLQQNDEADKNISENDEKRKRLRDISDLSYSRIVTTSDEASSSSKKDIEIKPTFKSTFVKRKSFEFKVDHQNKVTPKESNDNKIVLSKSTKGHVFPSLEDILKFKKKNLEVSTPTTPSVTENNIKLTTHQFNANSNKLASGCDPPDLGCVSLEEIFKCKRKLHDTPQTVKKLHADNSTSKPATVNNHSKNFTSVASHTKNDNHSLRKQECFSSNTNRSKVFNSRYKVIYKNDKQAASICSKETQTSSDLLLAPNSSGECQKKDIAVDTVEMGIINGKDVDDVSRNDKNNNRSLEDTKSIKQGKGTNSKNIQIENNVKESEVSSTSTSIRGSPLQNLTNMDTDDLVKDEDEGILLSIIEGKLMSQPSLNVNDDIKQKLNKSHDINCNKTSSNFTRCNSQILLESLFGDGAFKSNENNGDGSDDDIFSKLNQSISDSQLHNSLRVKTIDQINKEISSQPSQNTCDSMKILFGANDDVCSNIIPRNNKLGAHKYEKHHLLSSLFG